MVNGVGAGPACLDLRRSHHLEYIDFSERQMGEVLLPPTLSRKVMKQIKMRYPAEDQIKINLPKIKKQGQER